MPTCQSWRPKRHAKHPVPPAPGACRQCWTVCTNRVPNNVKRCDECTALLIASPNIEVRRALTLEPDALEATLLTLSEDEVFSVALSADNVLDTRGRSKQNLIANRRNSQTGFFDVSPGDTIPFPWATK